LRPLRSCHWIAAQFLNSKLEVIDERQEVLTSRDDATGGESAKRRPSEDLFVDQPALFREFAKLPPTKEAILRFAEEFGDLSPAIAVPTGHRRKRQPKPPADVAYDPTQFYPLGTRPGWEARAEATQKWNEWGAVLGTSLTTWQTEVCRMRLFLDLWDAAKSKNKRKLAGIIRATKKGQFVSVEAGGTDARLKELLLIPGTPAYAEPSDMVALAWVLLSNCLPLYLPVEASLIFGSRKRPTHVAFGFHSLRDALWAQLARAISDGRTFIECENCGKSMELSLEAHRTNRTLCSNACKSAIYRQRQRRAIDLHEKKWSRRQIAKEVGSDEATIKGWLDNHKAKRFRKSKGA
jgi:hypothetical protein